MNGPRHQIAHISFIAPADMPRFARLNVVADVSPMLWFPHAYTPQFEKVVGMRAPCTAIRSEPDPGRGAGRRGLGLAAGSRRPIRGSASKGWSRGATRPAP